MAQIIVSNVARQALFNFSGALFQPYFSFSISVFMKNGVGTDEDENPNAHGEGPEHLHPLRVTMLFQEPRKSAPGLLGGCTYMQNTWSV